MNALSTGTFATDRRLLESSNENLSDSSSSINSENIEAVLHGFAVLAGNGYSEALNLYRSLNSVSNSSLSSEVVSSEF